jgi:hypothetical protein
MDKAHIHMYWDHSNLFVRMGDTCDDGKGAGIELGHRREARLSFPALFRLAAAGRTVEKAVAAGSVPPDMQKLWQRLGKVGLIVDLQERGASSGKEVAVDQALEIGMLKSLLDRPTPAIAVLLSADGGFRDTLDRFLSGGWGVEVLAFSKGASPKLTRLPADAPGAALFVDLDLWYYDLVYLEDNSGKVVRKTSVLNLAKRNVL